MRTDGPALWPASAAPSSSAMGKKAARNRGPRIGNQCCERFDGAAMSGPSAASAAM